MYTKFTGPFATRRIGPPRSMFLVLVGTLLVAACGARAHAGDIYIACSAGVTLSMTDVRDVFLGEKQFSGPIKLLPVDNGAVQTEFLEKVMKMDATKYNTAWTKKSFRDGSTPPSVKSGDGEVVEFLKHSPGACGYLSSAPPAGLTLVGKI